MATPQFLYYPRLRHFRSQSRLDLERAARYREASGERGYLIAVPGYPLVGNILKARACSRGVFVLTDFGTLTVYSQDGQHLCTLFGPGEITAFAVSEKAIKVRVDGKERIYSLDAMEQFETREAYVLPAPTTRQLTAAVSRFGLHVKGNVTNWWVCPDWKIWMFGGSALSIAAGFLLSVIAISFYPMALGFLGCTALACLVMLCRLPDTTSLRLQTAALGAFGLTMAILILLTQ